MPDPEPALRIVADQSAYFPVANGEMPMVTFVPNYYEFAGTVYRDIDIPTQELINDFSSRINPPKLSPPSVVDYLKVYHAVADQTNAILSLHPSRKISENWEHARLAAQQMPDRVQIIVLDTQAEDVGLGLLVEQAYDLVKMGQTLSGIEEQVRTLSQGLYMAFVSQDWEYAAANSILGHSDVVMGRMHDVSPFFTLEDGEYMLTGKVKNGTQVIDALVNYLAEFEGATLSSLQVIHQIHTPQELIDKLVLRLREEFSSWVFETCMYGSALAAKFGADAIGLVLLENEMD